MNVDINFAPLGPEIIVATVATLLLIMDIIFVRKYRDVIGYVALFGLIGALAYALTYFGLRGELVVNQLAVDSLSVYIRLGILTVGIAIVLAAMRNTYTIAQNQGEFFALMLYSIVGTMIMAAARDMVTLYIGLELSTIPTFILVAFRKARAKAAEALIKFFILGLLSSAFLLYGLSLIYGLTGELNLAKIAGSLAGGMSPALAIASLLVIAGFGFKITAVPFHFWAPDTYEGAPVVVVSYIASVSKLGAYAILARFFIEALKVTQINWGLWFGALAVITMTLGNLMALPQNNIKRMMAYSGIGHTGYLLVGLAVGTYDGIWSMFFYLIAYVFAAIGVFFVISVHSTRGESDAISGYTGMAQTNPALALVMTMFFLSLIGIPPFAGFFGKYYLSLAAIKNNQVYLALLIFINSVISVGYYFKVIKAMYLQDPTAEKRPAIWPFTASMAMGISIIAIFYLGIIQKPIFTLAQKIYQTIKL